jgi:ribosome biogenesis GTPase A
MVSYWKLVNEVIDDSDILLLIIDARNPDASRNMDIEKKIMQKGKKLLYVINKADLVDKKAIRDIKFRPCVIMSATKHIGNMNLLRMLSRLSKGKKVFIGVLGYPNTGKSSVINALKGRQSAPVSSTSGYTKAKQNIRVSKNIFLIDTPGVFPRSETDVVKHALIGAKDVHKIKDPEDVACKIIEELHGKVEEHFKVHMHDDSYETIEAIALKLKFLKKAGIADTMRAAKEIIMQLQKGKIKT